MCVKSLTLALAHGKRSSNAVYKTMWLHIPRVKFFKATLLIPFQTGVHAPHVETTAKQSYCYCVQLFLGCVGDENMLSQNTPVEHNNYFELEAIEKKQTQENMSGLPLSTRKDRVILNHRRQPWANKRWHQRNLYNKLYCNNLYLLLVSPTHLLPHSLPPLKA